MFNRDLKKIARKSSAMPKVVVKHTPNTSNRTIGKVSAQTSFARQSSQRAIEQYSNTLRWLGGGDRMGK